MGIGEFAYFWTATESENHRYEAWDRVLSSHNPGIYRFYGKKYYGRSVRLVKD